MQPIDAKKQLAVIERIKALVEQAKEVLGDESCLDVLEGSEANHLAMLQDCLINACACLRALRKQLKGRA
jgi:hypothetical protein